MHPWLDVPCIVPEHLLTARVDQHVSLVRVDPNLADSHYVSVKLLNSPVYKVPIVLILRVVRQREALTQEIIGNLEIPLPTDSQQTQNRQLPRLENGSRLTN